MNDQIQETLTILDQAAALIAHGWSQGLYATDRSGEGTDWHGQRAARFCVIGALRRAWFDLEPREEELAGVDPKFGRAYADGPTYFAREYIFRAITKHRPTEWYLNLSEWNDRPDRTQEEVVATLVEAAQILQADLVSA